MSRLLIVEDEEIARTLYKRLLAQIKCTFDMAATLEDARKFVTGPHTYDLLVTDVRLPDGRGTDLLEEFHKRFPKALALVVTGSPEMTPGAEEHKTFPMPVEWLYKPFELGDFLQAVERLLSTQNGG